MGPALDDQLTEPGAFNRSGNVNSNLPLYLFSRAFFGDDLVLEITAQISLQLYEYSYFVYKYPPPRYVGIVLLQVPSSTRTKTESINHCLNGCSMHVFNIMY